VFQWVFEQWRSETIRYIFTDFISYVCKQRQL
jgi:hypothetical protein